MVDLAAKAPTWRRIVALDRRSSALRAPRVTSLVIGASRPEQLDENVAALGNLSCGDDELAEIDEYAVVDGDVGLWRQARTGALG